MTLTPLISVGVAMLAGSYIGGTNPEQVEAGANPARGRILGFRDGALFAAAFLPVIAAADMFLHGAASQLVEVAVVFVTLFGVLHGYGLVKEPVAGTMTFSVNRIVILAFAGLSVAVMMWQLGPSEAIVAPLLGWLGGMLFGGMVTEDKKLDFYGAVTAFSNRTKLTQLSAQYGAAAGLLFASCFSNALGEMGLLVIVVGSLVSGSVAGVLASIGRLNAAVPAAVAAETAPAAVETE